MNDEMNDEMNAETHGHVCCGTVVCISGPRITDTSVDITGLIDHGEITVDFSEDTGVAK